MTRIDTALSEAFGIPDTEREEHLPAVIQQPPVESNDDLDADISFVRGKLESLINKGESAVEMLTDIARAEESPRSFEVLNAMLTTLSDLSMQFISLHEKKAKIVKTRATQTTSSVPVNNTTNTTNIAFVGSSSDLDVLLEQRQQKKRELKDISSEEAITINKVSNS
jgi:Terminase DNA packaging enzyme